ncbi:Subtilisin-like protein [Mycena indigotica]|uniref:Subtilisin-like protein n=1 Tax=Mycena indigotica TaxID=2126181 RepID=A0A8H6S6C4_9AGAR|nr:Subtilisin-like protein [Mycena indigotica]KAF7293593.1 Subtilisin-like protein [Mycena indigotica]
MLFSRLWAFSFAAAVVYGRKSVVLDRRNSIPIDFVHSDVTPAEQRLNLRINLAQRDLPGLETVLNAASFPDSSLYGQWLSKEQVGSFVRPTEETTSAVAQWLAAHGIASTPLTHAGDWVSFTVPVSKANEMLNADFNIFTHVPSGKQSIRTLAYVVPAELAPHINLIAPTTSFSRPMRAGPMFTASNGVVPTPEAPPRPVATL